MSDIVCSLPEPSQLGRVEAPYSPTYGFQGDFIDRYHRFYAECALKQGILIRLRRYKYFGRELAGWLQREDALKLYELAYFATGDILELGTYHGLSTSILCFAARKSGKGSPVTSVELDPKSSEIARRHLRAMGLKRYANLIVDDAISYVNEAVKTRKRYSFVFIDHAHTYQAVHGVCEPLHQIVTPGGFCLLHDFNDERNLDGNDSDYGVFQAAVETLREPEWEFFGVFGCCGLYRRSTS